MSSRRLLATGSVALLALFGLVSASPAGATPPPKLVDVYVAATGHDSASCGSQASPCATITEGLVRVQPYGTIHVGAGTFAEQLVISEPVAISGAGAATVIAPSALPVSDTDTDSSLSEKAIVDVTPGTEDVLLSDLTIDGDAATPSFSGCGDDFVGIYFHSASGSVTDVTVENIALPSALSGCQDGQGIYVNAAPGTNAQVSIDRTTVTGYQKNGISCDDKGASCDITDSVVTGVGPTPAIAQNGIQVWSASAQIDSDTVTQNSYTDPLFDTTGYYTEAVGVLVINAGTFEMSHNVVNANDDNVYLLEDTNPADGLVPPAAPVPSAWSVTDNNLSGAVNNSDVPDGAGIGDSLDVDSTTAPIYVANNAADDSPEFGIAVLGASNVFLAGNEADDDGVGYFAAGPGTAGTNPTADTFFGNAAINSGLFGFYIYPNATGLTFLSNLAEQSGVDDVFDASSGSGTEATANLWFDTSCTTSSPTGLCSAYRAGHGHLPGFGGGSHAGGRGARGWRSGE